MKKLIGFLFAEGMASAMAAYGNSHLGWLAGWLFAWGIICVVSIALAAFFGYFAD